MSDKLITNNRFDPKKTKTIIIHDGRFHADDIMFAAIAIAAAEKSKNKLEIVRTSQLPEEYREDVVVGDIGLGIYDHHTDMDGTVAIGAQENDENHTAAACGLLYRDIKDMLFPGDSETKSLFEAFIDIIEHCDNTPDNNTFSDSINFFAPIDDNNADIAAMSAINYCKAIVNGFIEAHIKERSGKNWAVPRVCNGIVPGVADKRETRYWKASNQVRNRYKYVSFNNQSDMKLRSMDTYSLACGALTQKCRQRWRDEIEKNDAAQIAEMERREREIWPVAVKNMRSRTIFLEQYVPYGQYVKELPVLFIITPSQRGKNGQGYSVNCIKTSNGRYRFEPELLTRAQGCSFVANDKRFVFFDTKEQALNAAYRAGDTVGKYFNKFGFNGYRNIYGGLSSGYTGDFYQDLISEDIALNMYVREKIQNPNNMTVADYRRLQIAVMGNPYLTHVFCVRFDGSGEEMKWNFNASVTEISGLSKDTLLEKCKAGSRWDMGLQAYLNTDVGMTMLAEVYPTINKPEARVANIDRKIE